MCVCFGMIYGTTIIPRYKCPESLWISTDDNLLCFHYFSNF